MMDTPVGIPVKTFWYKQAEYDAWVAAHERWWPACSDASVWGPFEPQAVSGRYVFSHRDQARRHFGETFVARHFEQQGFVCWTTLRIFHHRGGHFSGLRDRHTKLAAALMRESLGIVPQEERFRQADAESLNLKNVDVVGYHFGLDRWILSEVKKDRDTLRPAQEAALEFLRRILPPERVEVFVSAVKRMR